MQGNARRTSPSRAHLDSSARPAKSTAEPLSRTTSHSMTSLALLSVVASLFVLPTLVQAYIPAVPVNDTSSLDSSSDLIHLAFYNGVYKCVRGLKVSSALAGDADSTVHTAAPRSAASCGQRVSTTTATTPTSRPSSRGPSSLECAHSHCCTLRGSYIDWHRVSQGVLVHFDETLRTQPPTSVPWIAMISCDTNGTNPSDEDDIFTITRDLGAQAALLYSLTSEVSRGLSYASAAPGGQSVALNERSH